MRHLLFLICLLAHTAMAQVAIPASRDSDGDAMMRIKYAPTGWHYQVHVIEFETCKLSSAYEKKSTLVDYGFVTLKFYKADDTEITDQPTLDTDCVRTQVDFEPTHDYEIVGGLVSQITQPTTDVRIWLIGAPDIPEVMGGNKAFLTGYNLAFQAAGVVFGINGRSSKYLPYDAVYHSGKMRTVVRTDAGIKHRIMAAFEIYKQ